jgi:hypothetical protein
LPKHQEPIAVGNVSEDFTFEGKAGHGR